MGAHQQAGAQEGQRAGAQHRDALPGVQLRRGHGRHGAQDSRLRRAGGRAGGERCRPGPSLHHVSSAPRLPRGRAASRPTPAPASAAFPGGRRPRLLNPRGGQETPGGKQPACPREQRCCNPSRGVPSS